MLRVGLLVLDLFLYSVVVVVLASLFPILHVCDFVNFWVKNCLHVLLHTVLHVTVEIVEELLVLSLLVDFPSGVLLAHFVVLLSLTRLLLIVYPLHVVAVVEQVMLLLAKVVPLLNIAHFLVLNVALDHVQLMVILKPLLLSNDALTVLRSPYSIAIVFGHIFLELFVLVAQLSLQFFVFCSPLLHLTVFNLLRLQLPVSLIYAYLVNYA